MLQTTIFYKVLLAIEDISKENRIFHEKILQSLQEEKMKLEFIISKNGQSSKSTENRLAQFQAVMCNSTLEHVYGNTEALQSVNEMFQGQTHIIFVGIYSTYIILEKNFRSNIATKLLLGF